jgi:hypothetical protein
MAGLIIITRLIGYDNRFFKGESFSSTKEAVTDEISNSLSKFLM